MLIQTYRITVDNRTYEVEIHQRPNFTTLEVLVNGNKHMIELPQLAKVKSTHIAPRQATPDLPQGATVASVPGHIADVFAKTGDKVKTGDKIIGLYSMKMNINIAAPRDGIITRLAVKVGQVVAKGQTLFIIEPPA